MTSKRSVKAILKRAHRPSVAFSVVIGGDEMSGTLSALPFMKWQEILAEHPPRDGNAIDEGWGFSYATFWPALIRESVTDPVMDDEDWDLFFETLTQGDVVTLGSQAFALNMRPAELAVPKSSSTSPDTTSPSSD
jgi:hypothetical protein